MSPPKVKTKDILAMRIYFVRNSIAITAGKVGSRYRYTIGVYDKSILVPDIFQSIGLPSSVYVFNIKTIKEVNNIIKQIWELNA
jgi:hypothetical protein